MLDLKLPLLKGYYQASLLLLVYFSFSKKQNYSNIPVHRKHCVNLKTYELKKWNLKPLVECFIPVVSEMDKKKVNLIDALTRLGSAQADILIERQKQEESDDVREDGQTVPGDGDHIEDEQVTLQTLDETWVELQKWIDMNDSKVIYLDEISERILCLSLTLDQTHLSCPVYFL